jgi:hypothetical protein
MHFLIDIFYDNVNLQFLDFNLRFDYFRIVPTNNYHIFLKENILDFHWGVS